MDKINKLELVTMIAEEQGIPVSQAEKYLKAVCSCIEKSLKSGKDLKIADLGIFEIKTRKARPGRNPKTGASLIIPETIVVRIKPWKNLRDAVL